MLFIFVYFINVFCSIHPVNCNTFRQTEEFEALKDSGQQHPEAYMLRKYRKAGQYQGCFSKSHWGGRRIKYKWDVFVQYAPNMSRRVMEIPNSLRPALGIEVQKLKTCFVV